MPELPEVETIARTLCPQVEGRKILGVRLLNEGTWQGNLPPDFLVGCTLGKPWRRGKLLVVPVVKDGCPDLLGLGIHLKMTGRVFVHPIGTPPTPHTRLLIDLDDGILFFEDTRKFGYVRILLYSTLDSWPFWQKLGPEPLELDATGFAACFNGRKGKLKSLLLNQEIIAGCGNIYADESLFRAGINPSSRAHAVDLAKLHECLQEVLHESIAACGSSIKDYRTANGDVGSFQNSFRVYGRSGEKCVQCGTELASCKVAGRATVYCPKCQALASNN